MRTRSAAAGSAAWCPSSLLVTTLLTTKRNIKCMPKKPSLEVRALIVGELGDHPRRIKRWHDGKPGVVPTTHCLSLLGSHESIGFNEPIQFLASRIRGAEPHPSTACIVSKCDSIDWCIG